MEDFTLKLFCATNISRYNYMENQALTTLTLYIFYFFCPTW